MHAITTDNMHTFVAAQLHALSSPTPHLTTANHENLSSPDVDTPPVFQDGVHSVRTEASTTDPGPSVLGQSEFTSSCRLGPTRSSRSLVVVSHLLTPHTTQHHHCVRRSE